MQNNELNNNIAESIANNISNYYLKKNNSRGACVYFDEERNPRLVIKVFDTGIYEYWEKEIYVWKNILSKITIKHAPQLIKDYYNKNDKKAALVYSYSRKYKAEYAGLQNDTNIPLSDWQIIIKKFVSLNKYFMDCAELSKETHNDIITKDYSCSIPLRNRDIDKFLSYNLSDIRNPGKSDKLAKLLKKNNKTMGQLYKLPVGLIHGDASIRNLVIMNDGLGYIDWEFAAVHSPVAELCQAADYFVEMDNDLADGLIEYFLYEINREYGLSLKKGEILDLIRICALLYIIQKEKKYEYLTHKCALTPEEEKYLNYIENIKSKYEIL